MSKIDINSKHLVTGNGNKTETNNSWKYWILFKKEVTWARGQPSTRIVASEKALDTQNPISCNRLVTYTS